MKSNLFKKATALGVAAAMVFSTSAFATQDVSDVSKQSTATGSSTVLAPTYKIKIPTNLNFFVDPYELGALATGSAINPRSAIKVPGYGYAISNQSNIAVRVDVEANLLLASNVYSVPLSDINTEFSNPNTLASKGASVAITAKDETNKEKEVSLYMLIASSPSAISTTGTNVGQPVVGTTYPTTTPDALLLNVIETNKAPAKASFALDKGIVNATGAPTGVVSTSPGTFGIFSFQGDVNALAPWAAKDVQVVVKYAFAPLSALDKAAVTYDSNKQSVVASSAVGAVNLPVTPIAPLFTTPGAIVNDELTIASPAIDLEFETVGAGYKQLLETGTATVALKFVGATTLAFATADYTVDLENKKITIKSAAMPKIKALANGDYSVEFTSKNGRTVKTTVEIQ